MSTFHLFFEKRASKFKHFYLHDFFWCICKEWKANTCWLIKKSLCHRCHKHFYKPACISFSQNWWNGCIFSLSHKMSFFTNSGCYGIYRAQAWVCLSHLNLPFVKPILGLRCLFHLLLLLHNSPKIFFSCWMCTSLR